MGADTQGADVLLDPLHLADVQKNIAPFAQVAIAGKDNSALAALTCARERGAGGDCADHRRAGIYAGVFGMPCHGRQWRAENRRSCGLGTSHRAGQGHSLQGLRYRGKGNMPPKGGTNWPDATIRMTVDYMVSLNK